MYCMRMYLLARETGTDRWCECSPHRPVFPGWQVRETHVDDVNAVFIGRYEHVDDMNAVFIGRYELVGK